MQSAPKIFIALVIAAFLTACAANDTQTSNSNSANQSTVTADAANSNSVKNNADELEMIINMPFPPEDVDFREEALGKANNGRVPGPTDKKLTAVLLFKKEDADKIVAQAGKYKAAAPETISPESWFPAELIAQSRTSGDQTLKGSSYPANDFYNAPYTDGKITHIEGTDYFVLELFAK